MKSTINLKHILTLCVTILVFNVMPAQEIIEEKKAEETVAITTDSVSSFKAKKIDGVAAVVGEYIILESDLDKAYLQLQAQGVNTSEIPRCQLFGKLL